MDKDWETKTHRPLDRAAFLRKAALPYELKLQNEELAAQNAELSARLKSVERSVEAYLASLPKDSSDKNAKRPNDKSLRRFIIGLAEQRHPDARGKNLDGITCQVLDQHNVPIPDSWADDGARLWMDAYQNPSIKERVQKLLSTQRRLARKSR